MEASLLTWFRKRITPDMISEINDYVIERNKNDDDQDNNPFDESGESDTSNEEDKSNEGMLILDATCVPSDIRFPTDVSLLNESREHLEKIIDEQHEKGLTNSTKPRTYRKIAHKEYMRFVRNRRPTRKLIQSTIKKQLGYIRRDLEAIKTYGTENLSPKALEEFEVIHKLYEQQKYMHENKTHKVDNRIVSIHQPWVRPIVRGKATANVEFEAKVSLSVHKGYLRIEHLNWDAYNESTTLQETVELYKKQTGIYPQRILADKIYRTRNNLQYCKKYNIRMNGPKLGRPPKDKELYAQQCYDERKESGERNEVEGKFGTAKRCYGLDRLTSRLQNTGVAKRVFKENPQKKGFLLFDETVDNDV